MRCQLFASLWGIAAAVAFAGCGPSGATRAAAPFSSSRTMEFPAGESIGDLWVRANEGDPWTRLAPARGSVSIPNGSDVRLDMAVAGALDPVRKGFDWPGNPIGGGDRVAAEQLYDSATFAAMAPDALTVLDLSAPGMSQAARAPRATLWYPPGMLAFLPRLQGLEELSLADTRPWPGDFEFLGSARSLRTLHLGNTRTGDDALAHLTGLTSLEVLYLRDNPITDAGLERLASLPSLRELHLTRDEVSRPGEPAARRANHQAAGNDRITDAGMKAIGRMTGLETLVLRGTRVTGAGLRELRGLKRLRELDLAYTRIMGRDLDPLRGMGHLRSLNLRGLYIRDGDLHHLLALKGLATLDLSDTRVTADGLARLQRALPRCVILPLRNTPQPSPTPRRPIG